MDVRWMRENGEGMGKAYYWSIVVHFGEEFFERCIFAGGEFRLRRWCNGIDIIFWAIGRWEK
jgi:hypothetical protein